MENQPQGLKEIVAQQPYITCKSSFFGLFHHLVYAPTDSRLEYKNRLYAPVVREQLKELFALTDEVFAKRLAKTNRYEQAVNGNMLVECYCSKDRAFVALCLKQFTQIDYVQVSEVHILQGDAAQQAAKVFDL